MRRRLCAFLVIFTCIVRFGASSDWRIKREEPVVEERWITEFANNCSCVHHNDCDNDGFVITKGASNPRPTPDNRIKCSGGKFDGEFVCCKRKPQETANLKTKEIPATTTTAATTTTTPEYTTSTPSSVHASTKRRKSIKCGKARPQLDVRIFGNELNPLQSEFPWLAAIYRKRSGKKWQYQKLGSLIHPKVVLTATHVVGRVKSDQFKVIVNGEIELSAIGDKEQQERNVKEVIRHQNFSSGSLYNDIALLILEEPYNISTSNINTICLRPEIPFENKRCYVVGWGNTPNGIVSTILKKVEVPVLSRGTCQELLRKARYGDYYMFHESFMCAGGEEGKGSCNGDGGSPLVCPSGINNGMYQVGILAYGLECGKKDVPDVYADVTYFHDWIAEELKNRDIEI